MNKMIATIMCVAGLSSYTLAQNLSDTWTVYEPATQEEVIAAISNAETNNKSYLVPASVVADDDREEVTGHASHLEKAVVVLEMTTNQGRRALCSGSVVGPNIVLTAAHCLNSQGEFMKEVRVYAVGMPDTGNGQIQPPTRPNKPPQVELPDSLIRRTPKPTVPKTPAWLNEITRIIGNKLTHAEYTAQGSLDDILKDLRQGGYPSATAQKMWVPNEYIKFTRHKQGHTVDLDKEELYDYGILVLDNAMGQKTGWLGLSVKSSQELQARSIMVVGRGGDKPARSLWKSPGRIGQVHKRYFFHNADQVGGNSGGPIFEARDTTRIIALANFGDARQHVPGGYPNGGLRITQAIVNAVNQAK